MKIGVKRAGYANLVAELSRVPCAGEYIELPDQMVVEVQQVIHVAEPGEGKAVAIVRTVVAG